MSDDEVDPFEAQWEADADSIIAEEDAEEEFMKNQKEAKKHELQPKTAILRSTTQDDDIEVFASATQSRKAAKRGRGRPPLEEKAPAPMGVSGTKRRRGEADSEEDIAFETYKAVNTASTAANDQRYIADIAKMNPDELLDFVSGGGKNASKRGRHSEDVSSGHSASAQKLRDIRTNVLEKFEKLKGDFTRLQRGNLEDLEEIAEAGRTAPKPSGRKVMIKVVFPPAHRMDPILIKYQLDMTLSRFIAFVAESVNQPVIKLKLKYENKLLTPEMRLASIVAEDDLDEDDDDAMIQVDGTF